MNIQEAWDYGRLHLTLSSPYAELDARLLLEYVLQKPHSYIVAFAEIELTLEQQQSYFALVQRAVELEPIPYLTGTAVFLDLVLSVTPAVLIPRPETEELVELAVKWGRQRPTCHIVDVGTGSGNIAISLAQRLPHATITAVDISTQALNIARKNATTYVPGRINFLLGDLLTPLVEPVDLIVANLPYIADDEWTQVDDGVKLHEPLLALQGGADGLKLINKVLWQAQEKLMAGGAIFLEVGWQQGIAAQKLARAFFPNASINLLVDIVGHERFVQIQTVFER
ncbi:MAG: peptide chain release factor N(5)-glutamine methyltransferase [Anaerolineales bacterium]|nr:peptide chain release factor N(5)-glutamine methyltransferase [Anaerolineales bacterium]